MYSLFISTCTVKGLVHSVMSYLCSVIFLFISLISLSTCFVLPSSRTVDEEKSIDDLQVVFLILFYCYCDFIRSIVY